MGKIQVGEKKEGLLTKILEVVTILDPHLVIVGLGHLELHDNLGLDLVHMFAKSSQLDLQVGIFLHRLFNLTSTLLQLAHLSLLFINLGIQEMDNLFIFLHTLLIKLSNAHLICTALILIKP